MDECYSDTLGGHVMRYFENEYTKEISFPLGGIGTGSIGIGGNGRFLDWEIFNKPAKGSENGYSHFAVRAISKDGRIIAKALCGDTLKDFVGQYSKKSFTGYGFGVSKASMAGFPHFEKWSFESRFPFAQLNFESEGFPAKVRLKAFNPFIPLDEDNSSIPAAFFELEFENVSDEELTFSGALSLNRPFTGTNTETACGGARGIFMRGDADESTPEYRDMTLLCLGDNIQVQPYWYRGQWQDKIVTFWREFSQSRSLLPRTYSEINKGDVGTVCADVTLAPSQRKSIRFLISWNTPNCTKNTKFFGPDESEEEARRSWKNYYAVLWKDSRASGTYSFENWDTLEARSRAFSDAIYSTDMDEELLETAVANLSTLKSPTVLRLEDGTLWGWEGVHECEGSCPGTCTHVWTYAYAIPFLFPRLERGMREAEFKYSMFESGMMAFRIPLPIGRKMGDARPCVDGQMGAVIKTFREWKLSGDTEWLRSVWQSVKRALEYAWVDDGEFSWDADRDGVLEGRQHHTLDMELFGSSAWLEGFYIAALRAAAEMASALGYDADAQTYLELAKKGSEWTENNLFNGEYYVQKVELTDESQPARFNVSDKYWNAEAGEIKYQIGDGCEIDQLLAQWHATICGLGDIFDKANRRTALKNIYKYNHKSSMRDFVNPWRIFALNDESGTVMCEYPEGVRKPAVPLPYAEECMAGFEYALGALMLSEGMEEEGKTVIGSVYSRYDGKKRNPYSEIECGNNYARGMASWSFIPIMSGFECDMVKKRIGFYPRTDKSEFTSFWSCADAWGTVTVSQGGMRLCVTEGKLSLSELGFIKHGRIAEVRNGAANIDFEECDRGIRFEDTVCVSDIITVSYS